uniref:Uncharacterized protein n=1 Tax=Oryza punctata TaxID=4537 RepID=A0A0E0MIE6_ORYPU
MACAHRISSIPSVRPATREHQPPPALRSSKQLIYCSSPVPPPAAARPCHGFSSFVPYNDHD